MSESYKAEGEIIRLSPTQEISEKFRKREFVLELPDPKYPQPIKFQVTGARCEELNPFKKGDTLAVEFNLRGRFWQSPEKGEMHFISLDVWKLKRTAEGPEELPLDGDIPF